MKLNALLIVVLLFCSACTRDTKADQQLRYVEKVVSTPEKLAYGVISTDKASEFDICFSPDGMNALFTRRIGDKKQKLWQTTFHQGVWSNPVQLSFSTDRDETPFFSPDGKTLYFGSTRPIEGRPSRGNFDMNIWQVERRDDTWGSPKPLSPSINAVQEEKEEWPSSNENFIFSLDDKNFMYSTMRRGEKVIDIYTTMKNGDEFSLPEKISGLFENEASWKYSAVLSPDGRYLLFNSYEAEGGVGGEDIFIAKKTAQGWSKAKSIGNLVNTAAEESSPRFSPDGKYFFFGREFRQTPEEDGIWNIFYIETKFLDLENLF